MTETTQPKVNSQGATAENLDPGQGTAGAPQEPKDKAPPKVEQVVTEPVKEIPPVQQAVVETKPVVSDWPEFQDSALSASASVFKEAGLNYADVTAAFAKVKETGKIEDVDLATLETKLGKEKAALAMIGIKDYHNRQVAQTNETVKAVQDVFGGEQAYNTAKAWALDKAKTDQAFAEDLKKYGSMFNAGGVSARAAARDLLQQYNADPSTSGVKTKMVNGDKTVQVGASETPLNRYDYMKLLKEAHKKGDRTEITRLDARRRAGIKLKM